MSKVHLFVQPDGEVLSIYQEEFPLISLGKESIKRASDVEPEDDGTWSVLFRHKGKKVNGFKTRSQALAYEVAELDKDLRGGCVK